MKCKLFLPFIVLSFIFSSCDNSTKYSAPVFKTERSLQWTHVTDELEVMNTHWLFEYKDWLILIASKGNNKDSFYLYDKRTGDCLTSGVKSANGPKETVYGTLSVSFQNGILSYYDCQLEKRLFFSIDEYIKNGVESIHEEEYNSLPCTVKVTEAGDKLVYFRNKGYKAKDTLSVPRLEVVDKDGGRVCYNKETLEDPVVRFWVYMQPKYTVSPDGRKFAMSCNSGATIMESFSIDGGIKNIATKYLFEPSVTVDGYDIMPSDDSVLGISDLCSTNKWIIASYDGDNTWYEAFESSTPKAPYTNIAVFDWDLKPLCLYKSDIRIEHLCFDENSGTVYAVVKEADGSYYISRAEIDNTI